MANEDHQNRGDSSREYTVEEYSFDELAKGLAEQTITRGRALKLVGAALLGAVGLVGLPRVADARKKKKKKKKRHKAPTCGAGISPTCSQCGTPTKSGEVCTCVLDADNTPQCINFTQGAFPPCTTNGDCGSGAFCVDFTPCGFASKNCASPCT